MRKTLLALSLISLLALTACGGGKDPIEAALENAAKNGGGGAAATGPARTSTVKGKITFEGTPPTPKTIPTSSDPGCKGAKVVDEAIVVSDGGLENVILYVSAGAENQKYPVPAETVTLSQEGCHYKPHALTIMTGQKLKVVNNDETAHNVHAWAMVNPPFNTSQPSKGVENEYIFEKEEVLLPVRCDVHNWMNSFIGVFKHPLSTVSTKGGAYELKLPAGTYTITAEHEKLGKQEMMVTVAENGSADLNFTFKGQ
jgi:plastocyanin